MDISGIYFITDRTYCSLSMAEMVFVALKAGVRVIQYRDKDKSRREMYYEALKLRELTLSFNSAFIINDHADIALAVDADGLHLGQEDLPLREARRIMGNKIIGISTHTLAQAQEAEAGDADYIGFGPIFHTSTKDAGPPEGLDNLRTIKENVSIPVVAIGGINAGNITQVFYSGADAAAIATGICRGDINKNAELLVRMARNQYP